MKEKNRAQLCQTALCNDQKQAHWHYIKMNKSE